MKQTDYTAAVAAVRYKETSLLGSAFLEQLIAAPTYADARRLLAEKGLAADGPSATAPVDGYMDDTWRYLSGLSADLKPLSFLIVGNDFHNAKAVIKCIVRSEDPAGLLLTPSLIPPRDLQSVITRKAFEELPDWLQKPAADGYELLTATMDGQLFDMAMDRAALITAQKMAADSGSAWCARLEALIAALTNVRVAYRLSERRMGKNPPEQALCPCPEWETEDLLAAVAQGPAGVSAFLLEHDGEDLADAYAQSPAALEKAADDRLLAVLKEAAWSPFGVEPLAAYYLARQIEWKNLRIILSAKHAGLPAEAIRERMRVLYG
ncbi:MAG: V0D/AC39 family V-type ATPase subunit [Acutalibacteraceae bacterium]|jgi:V/A-type H+-transporting ATPase subunit C